MLATGSGGPSVYCVGAVQLMQAASHGQAVCADAADMNASAMTSAAKITAKYASSVPPRPAKLSSCSSLRPSVNRW